MIYEENIKTDIDTARGLYPWGGSIVYTYERGDIQWYRGACGCIVSRGDGGDWRYICEPYARLCRKDAGGFYQGQPDAYGYVQEYHAGGQSLFLRPVQPIL